MIRDSRERKHDLYEHIVMKIVFPTLFLFRDFHTSLQCTGCKTGDFRRRRSWLRTKSRASRQRAPPGSLRNHLFYCDTLWRLSRGNWDGFLSVYRPCIKISMCYICQTYSPGSFNVTSRAWSTSRGRVFLYNYLHSVTCTLLMHQ